MNKEEFEQFNKKKIGRAHVWTPVTFLYLVCRLLLEKKKKKKKSKHTKKYNNKKKQGTRVPYDR